MMKKLFLIAVAFLGLSIGSMTAQSCCSTAKENCKPKTCCPAATSTCCDKDKSDEKVLDQKNQSMKNEVIDDEKEK